MTQLEELAETIVFLGHENTYNQDIIAYTKGLNIIRDIKKQEQVEDKEWLILRKLANKLVEAGITTPVTNTRSYKRNRLHDLTMKVITEIETIPYIEDEKVEIKTVDDWIKSLKVFKLKDSFLSMEYYQTSYDMYQNIRKIVLNKNAPVYKRIYVGRVVNELISDDNKTSFPENLDLKAEDYELFELIRLIKDNPNFNYNLMKSSHKKYEIDYRFEKSAHKNKILLIVKEQK